jgi:nitroreductase
MVEPISNPWSVNEADFPTAGTPSEQWHFLLNYAVLAPSRHNTQPWLFKIEGHTVELHADRSRALPAADPDDRELIISCGAAFANLLVALRHFGCAPIVDMHTDPDEHEVLACISIEKGNKATELEDKLFHAITQRRTNRQLFKDREVPSSLLSTLEGIAGWEGTSFQVVQGEEARNALANLIAAGDRMLWADEAFRQEIAAWTRQSDLESHDGVPEYAFGKGDSSTYLGPLKIHTFMDHGEKPDKHHLATGSPVFAVLWTFTDTWFDWFVAGKAMERILLYARAEGVWASFFNQPIEVASLRKELRDLLGETDFPQLILRMGYGPEVPHTPRRSVHDVLL